MVKTEAPAHASLCDRLRKMLGPDGLAPGSRIPSLRELASRLQVSHVLVAKHLRQLEDEGLVVQGSQRIRYTRTSGVAVAASSSRRGLPTGTVVVLSGLQQVDPTSPYQYHNHMLLAISRELHEAGMLALVVKPPQSDADLERIAAMDADAWIAAETGVGRNIGLLALLAGRARSGCPVAIAGDTLTGTETADFPGALVFTDHRGGAAGLVRALAARGRRRLAVAWTDRAHPDFAGRWMTERAAGIAEGVAACGLQPARSLTLPTLSEYMDPRQGFDLQTQAWAGGLISSALRSSEPIDGLLAASDGAAFPLIAASRLLGRDPGVDLDVTGYDNFWQNVPERTWAGVVPCATVDKDGDAVGRALAAAVCDPAQRQARHVIPSHVIVTDPELLPKPN